MPCLFVESYFKAFKLQVWGDGLVFRTKLASGVVSVVERRACSQPVWEESRTGLSCLSESKHEGRGAAWGGTQRPSFILSKAAVAAALGLRRMGRSALEESQGLPRLTSVSWQV